MRSEAACLGMGMLEMEEIGGMAELKEPRGGHPSDEFEGNSYDLSVLDNEELELLRELLLYALQHPDARTAEYRNFYIQRVGSFYEQRGWTRSETIQSLVWEIAQRIGGQLMVTSGLARESGDDRTALEQLDARIIRHYGGRKDFCNATGTPEFVLDRLFAQRKPFSMDWLSGALAKIGYTIQITQMPDVSPPA